MTSIAALGDRQDDSARSYVCRHWQGRLSLARSFWVNGLGLSIAIELWALELARWFLDSTTGPLLALIITYRAIASVLGVWQWVGIWRASGSANVHGLARLLVRTWVIGAAVYAIYCGVRIGIAFANRRSEPPARIRVLGKSDEAELRGGIGDGSSAAAAAFLESHPDVRTLHLTSPGGRANEALRLASLVRERRLRVIVDSYCASACTLTFLAGAERLIRPEAKLGFHSARVQDQSDSIRSNRETVEALNSVDASPAFIVRAIETASYDLWEPPSDRLLKEHVVTAIAGADQFTYCPPYETLEEARQGFELDGTFSAMAELDPEHFRRVLQDYMDGPSRGTTYAEALTKLSAAQTQLTHEAYCHPAVTAARAYVERQLKLLTAIGARFPERCPAVFSTGIDPTGLSAEERGRDDQKILKNFLVESYRARPSRPPSPAEVEEAKQLRRAKMSPRARQTLEEFERDKRGSPAALCSALSESYQALASLEPEMIVRLLRHCPTER